MIACDVSEEFTAMARRYWKEAGVEQKVELRLGPAVETLQSLIARERPGLSILLFSMRRRPNTMPITSRRLKLVRQGG